METATGLVIASSINTIISGAQLQEESEWGVILNSPLFRYIVVYSLAFLVSKTWTNALLILFYWLLIKSFLKVIILRTGHLSENITPNITSKAEQQERLKIAEFKKMLTMAIQ